LLRQEEDTVEDWRALSFYQIGGVIHDLVMRRPLFEEFLHPYARLVMAIQNEVPVLQSHSSPSYLVDLGNTCLLKDPQLRVRFLNWGSFEAPGTSAPVPAKDQVGKRIALSRAMRNEAPSIGVENLTEKNFKRTIVDYLKVAARSIRAGSTSLPPIKTTLHPQDGSGLCIAFAASAAHEIPQGLSIYVGVEVLDLAAKAIVIRGCACRHKAKPEEVNPHHIVFEGIYDGANVHQRFEDFMFEAFLWAQTAEDEPRNDKCWPRP
jgi:hypothetical protein